MECVDSADPPLAVHYLTVAVVINIAALVLEEPAVRVGILALIPLILLLLNGLYLFVWPHATQWRGRRRADLH